MLYPHALEKELVEMLSVVTRRKQVKGQDNLEQQVAELKEVFAMYDEDGTGELEQAEFVEAIVSAGRAAAVHACCVDTSIPLLQQSMPSAAVSDTCRSCIIALQEQIRNVMSGPHPISLWVVKRQVNQSVPLCRIRA